MLAEARSRCNSRSVIPRVHTPIPREIPRPKFQIPRKSKISDPKDPAACLAMVFGGWGLEVYLVAWVLGFGTLIADCG